MKVLITGSSGYLGSNLYNYLLKNGYDVVRHARHRNSSSSSEEGWLFLDIGPNTDWSPFLKDIDVVVHCAGVSIQPSISATSAADFFEINNCDSTLNLARHATESKVKKFIYISSIKANGEFTQGNEKFTEKLPSKAPSDPYGRSKYLAEIGLKKIFTSSSSSLVVIRPPMIYGPLVKNNFSSLVKLAKLPLPLPFLSLNNSRSLVFVGNICDLISVCISSENADDGTFLVSDDQDVSTKELLKKICLNIGLENKLFFHFPMSFIHFLLKILGKDYIYNKAFGDLNIDVKHTKKILNWAPPYTVDEAVKLSLENDSNSSHKVVK